MPFSSTNMLHSILEEQREKEGKEPDVIWRENATKNDDGVEMIIIVFVEHMLCMQIIPSWSNTKFPWYCQLNLSWEADLAKSLN